MRSLRTLLAAVATAALTLTLASCAGEQGTGSSPQAIQVTDALGTKQLERPAQRVVALEWTYVEGLLALGVQPVGVADIKGYNTWVTAGPRPGADTVDVGTRQEPSIEKIAALDPDLIVTDYDRVAANREALEGIAPLLAFNPYDANRPQLESMRAIFTELARAVGREAKAREVLAAFDKGVAETKARLERAGKQGLRFVASQGFTQEAAPVLRLFTDKALVVQVLEAAGLENAWDGEPDPYGMTTVDPEALTRIPEDATFLYVAARDDNIFTGALARNPVWKGLKFVREGRVHALDPGTWFFGGPLSCRQILEEAAKALGA